ncbi:MAG: GNAT family N-acetyltransferase [Phycisphaerae bacterium]|nr:GNAT family N-acetyltransferase [Phycisphaerae bacterium]
MSDLRLEILDNPPPERIREVDQSLGRYNQRFTGPCEDCRFAIIATDESGATAGGLIATISWGWCYIDVLWLRDDLRGEGHGHRLLITAEQHALSRGIRNTYLWTTSFQAPKFYLDHGYAIFGQLEDCPPGYTKFYLRKTLAGGA